MSNGSNSEPNGRLGSLERRLNIFKIPIWSSGSKQNLTKNGETYERTLNKASKAKQSQARFKKIVDSPTRDLPWHLQNWNTTVFRYVLFNDASNWLVDTPVQMVRGLEDLVKSMKHCVETSEAYLTSYKATFSSNGQEEDVKPGKGKRKHSDAEEPVVDGKRKRIVKAKDPNAPRRPASTYLLFQNEMRKATKQDHPNITFQELTSLMSKMWSEMSAAEKQVRRSFPVLLVSSSFVVDVC